MNHIDGKCFNDFMTQHRFVWTETVDNELICGKCKNILIDANQVPCGCNFCRDCVDKMIDNGAVTCPGNTDICYQGKLSESLQDFKVNRRIMKLVLKCPESLCVHECELDFMQEHLRICEIKGVRCPFYHIGCVTDKITKDKMTDHLQSQGYKHNMILISFIENLRNEVDVLKQNDVRNSREIQTNETQIMILKENSRLKDETIAVIQEEIRLMKEERQEMAAQINNLKIESHNKMVNSNETMANDWQNNLGVEMMKINDEMQKWQTQLTKRANEVAKWQDKQIDGTVVMKIIKTSDGRKSTSWICSPIFYPRTRPYKMQLRMENYAGSDELYVRLLVHAGEMDGDIQWPFQGIVTVKITKVQPNSSKSITKYCQIDKPNNNSYKCSDPFKFSNAELSCAGLMQDNYVIVECNVE